MTSDEARIVKDALDAAWQDLHEWRRLAEEQRKAHPDPNHAAQMPSQAGIDKTRWILDALMPPAFLALETQTDEHAALRQRVADLEREHISREDREQALELAIPDEDGPHEGMSDTCPRCEAVSEARRLLKLDGEGA